MFDSMSDYRKIGFESPRERELLGRCKPHAFLLPESSPTGSKDVLYHTPCGRWIRIVSADVELSTSDPDWYGYEFVSRVNTVRAAEIFDRYRWPRPPELARTDRDQEFDDSLAADLFPLARDSAKRSGGSVPDYEEFVASCPSGERIPAGSLVGVLEDWSAGCPGAPTECDLRGCIAALTDCQRTILLLLFRAGYRMTDPKIISKISKVGHRRIINKFGEPTIKKTLKKYDE